MEMWELVQQGVEEASGQMDKIMEKYWKSESKLRAGPLGHKRRLRWRQRDLIAYSSTTESRCICPFESLHVNDHENLYGWTDKWINYSMDWQISGIMNGPFDGLTVLFIILPWPWWWFGNTVVFQYCLMNVYLLFGCFFFCKINHLTKFPVKYYCFCFPNNICSFISIQVTQSKRINGQRALETRKCQNKLLLLGQATSLGTNRKRFCIWSFVILDLLRDINTE